MKQTLQPVFCVFATVALLALPMIGCGGDAYESDAEEAVDTATEAMEEAADSAEETMEEAGEMVEGAMDDAGETAEDAMEEGAEVVDDAMEEGEGDDGEDDDDGS